MNLKDMLWFASFVGVGAGLGKSFGGTYGTFIGILIGLVAVIGLSKLNEWSGKQTPGCSCGNSDLSKFKGAQNPKVGHVFECELCNTQYLMRKGYIWDKVNEAGERIPYQRRGFFEKWHVVE